MSAPPPSNESGSRASVPPPGAVEPPDPVLASWLERIRIFVTRDLWQAELHPRSFAARAQSLLQLVVMIGEGFVRDQLLLRASALTYVSALSVVPLLAVALSIAGALIGTQGLAELVVNRLVVGNADAEAALLNLVESVDFRGLGPASAGLLFATTVLAIRHAEVTLNQIWGVRQGRSWVRRFTDYLAVIVVAPLLTATALSLATALKSDPLVTRLLEAPAFSTLYEMGLGQAPTVFYLLAFAFLYWFLPNTRVRVLSALLGGVVAALLFTLAQHGFVTFVVGSARYSTLFGSFAALPLLLLWMYLSWAIVLLGAEVSFAHQNLARYRREAVGAPAGPAEREALALRVGLEVARAFRAGDAPRSAHELAEALDAPVRTVRDLLTHLEAARIVSGTAEQGEREGGFQLARPADHISVGDVLRAVRGQRDASSADGSSDPTRRIAARVLGELELALEDAGLRTTLRELIEPASDAPGTAEG